MGSMDVLEPFVASENLVVLAQKSKVLWWDSYLGTEITMMNLKPLLRPTHSLSSRLWSLPHSPRRFRLRRPPNWRCSTSRWWRGWRWWRWRRNALRFLLFAWLEIRRVDFVRRWMVFAVVFIQTRLACESSGKEITGWVGASEGLCVTSLMLVALCRGFEPIRVARALAIATDEGRIQVNLFESF